MFDFNIILGFLALTIVVFGFYKALKDIQKMVEN